MSLCCFDKRNHLRKNIAQSHALCCLRHRNATAQKEIHLFSSYLLVLPRRKAQWSARSLLMSYNSRAGQQCIVFAAAEEAAVTASLLIYRPWHGMPHFTPRPDRLSCRWPHHCQHFSHPWSCGMNPKASPLNITSESSSSTFLKPFLPSLTCGEQDSRCAEGKRALEHFNLLAHNDNIHSPSLAPSPPRASTLSGRPSSSHSI